jgi:hypothetical protein
MSPDHEWEATPAHRLAKGSDCPFCKGHRISVTNSLAMLKPVAAAQWDWEKNDCGPADVVAGSIKKYWFHLNGKGTVLRSPRNFKR